MRAELQSAAFPISCWMALAASAMAQTCYAPPRPFVPQDVQAQREYSDLIQADFETYLADIQAYFVCLERERSRAFEEAGEVSNAYGEFLNRLRPNN